MEVAKIMLMFPKHLRGTNLLDEFPARYKLLMKAGGGTFICSGTSN